MEKNKGKSPNKYGRVMPRVYNRSRSSLDSRSFVTRHEKSSPQLGGKTSVSNASSSVFSELPIVLNDYNPEESERKAKKASSVVKPRRTLRSMDPCKSPYKSPLLGKSAVSFRAPVSAPSVVPQERSSWTDRHARQCYSSRSNTGLKEIKEEIKSYRETDKLLRFRAKLYKNCGVVLDDVGDVCLDKAVQADDDAGEEIDTRRNDIR